MAVDAPGDAVLELMRNATNRIVIVAPFIKSATICQLLEAVPDTVSELLCVTRWLPEDIASGVCDLEIFDDVAQAQDGRLLVHPHLHAKYYSNGQQTLVGSANITSRGLGWHTPSNVEILVALPAEFPGLTDWETSLLISAVEVTEQLREQIRVQAELLKKAGPERYLLKADEEVRDELWVPRCPVPERLWQVYCGHGADTMVSSAFEAAQIDLSALSPPQGLSEDLFNAYVGGILRQMPLLTAIDNLALNGLTDMKAHDYISDSLGGANEVSNDGGRVWRIVKLWLLYFFPQSYRLETGQEVLVKGREIVQR